MNPFLCFIDIVRPLFVEQKKKKIQWMFYVYVKNVFNEDIYYWLMYWSNNFSKPLRTIVQFYMLILGYRLSVVLKELKLFWLELFPRSNNFVNNQSGFPQWVLQQSTFIKLFLESLFDKSILIQFHYCWRI